MATPPNVADFLIRFPVFSTLDTLTLESALDESVALLDSTAWGDFWGQAIMLDAAHTLTMDSFAGSAVTGGMQGAGGPISSVSAAGVSASFATPPGSGKNLTADWYNKTIYGQRFLRLRNVVIPAADISL